MNYRKAYYELLAFLADLVEEIESNENSYISKINQKIEESDEKIVNGVNPKRFIENFQKSKKHSWQE